MGLRGASFKLLEPDKRLPANAGLVTEHYQYIETTITCDGREIPTMTVWSGRLNVVDHAASSYSMLRPKEGDWPSGRLRIVARQGVWEIPGGPPPAVPREQRPVLADCEVEVGPALEGKPPTCQFVSGPRRIHFMSHPGGGQRPPSMGITIGSVNDQCGPMVSIDVEYTINGISHTCRGQDIAQAPGGATIELQGGADAEHQIQRIRITNVLGQTLEILPPFPQGAEPAGPWFMKR